MLVAAIRRTPGGYLQQVLDSRNPGSPTQKGSCWKWPIRDMEVLLHYLRDMEITEFSPEGGGFVPRADRPCRYFRAPIPGLLGVVPLASLDPDQRVWIADPKKTCGTPGGGVEAHWYVGDTKVGEEASTTFILGPAETPEGEYILWTCHPGAPSPRYSPVDRPDLIGQMLSVREAIAIGLTGVNLR